MQLFQPFGCMAYINIAKEVRRKIHKGRSELAIFIGFEENTIPVYKCYRPIYIDFLTKAHARFMKFARCTDINLTPQSEDLGLKDGLVYDFKYLEETVHRGDVDGLVRSPGRITLAFVVQRVLDLLTFSSILMVWCMRRCVWSRRHTRD